MPTQYSKAVIKIARIISRRDDISLDEACELVEETRLEIVSAAEEGALEAAYEIMSDNLGLEPDYIDELIF